jgi:hypothetical protein
VRRHWAALLLFAYGFAFAVAAFGRGVPGFDDHPGQLFRLWHGLERAFPEGSWTADWNPDWWGGYPELQFYPPGFVILGALIRLVALGHLSVETTYQVLCGFTLLLPAAGTYALMAGTLENPWLALPPAFLALTLSAELRGGVEESLRWGMVTSRLALGGLPFLALALRPWVERGRRAVWAPVVAAAVLLCHPAAGPAVAVILGVATLLAYARRPGRPTVAAALVVTGLALALTAFWTVPFLVRRFWVIPLAWGAFTPSELLDAFRGHPVLLGSLALVPLAWVAVFLRRRPFDALLATIPVVLLVVLVVDATLFTLGWSSVEPARVVDGFVLTAVWAAGLGVGVVASHFAPRRWKAPGQRAAAITLVGLAALLARGSGVEPTLTLWPRAADWPTVERIAREHDLSSLWSAIGGKPDRVLFLTSSVKLDRDPAWYAPHTHILSLAPLLAGREIVNGTFTHPSPLAARFYTGRPIPPARNDTLVEKLDGRTLLGQPWESLPADAFDAFARRLRVATVVVPTDAVPRARFLGSEYVRGRDAAGFTLFERRDRPWPRVERITRRRYRVLISPTGGVWIPTGILAYPLWTVKSSHGVLETRADPWGLLEFRVPVDVFEAELVYSEGWLEWTSLALSIGGGLVWLGWAWRGRPSRRPRPALSPSALERRRRA